MNRDGAIEREEELSASIRELTGRLAQVTEERDQYRKLYNDALLVIKKLELGLTLHGRERFVDNADQLSFLFVSMGLSQPKTMAPSMTPSVAPAMDDSSHPKHSDDSKKLKKERPRRRQRLPSELARVDIELLPDEVKREGLNAFDQIGVEVSETLERRRKSEVVLRVSRPKFVRVASRLVLIALDCDHAANRAAYLTLVDDLDTATEQQFEPQDITDSTPPLLPEPQDITDSTMPDPQDITDSTTLVLPELGGSTSGQQRPEGTVSQGTSAGVPSGDEPEGTPVKPPTTSTEPENKVLIAPLPELPIPKGLAGPSMLAHTIVVRWKDKIPLHRMQGIFARDGLNISKSTICGWHMQLYELCNPLVEAMFEDALQQPILMCDATGVLVLAPKKCRHAHFWVLIAPERHVLFRFSRHHDSKAIDCLLPDYHGYLVADAHTVYDHLYNRGSVVEVGCWSHGRRYFFKSFTSDPERSRHALNLLRDLFLVEREAALLTPEGRHQLRALKSAPLVQEFFTWCELELPKTLEDSPIHTAIQYVLNQRQALERFLTDPRLPCTNNQSEGALRQEAVGRKNWLFVANTEGGKVNAVFVSLLASCELHEIEPESYLRDLLFLLPSWSQTRLLDLSPLKWKETMSRPEVKKLLDDNPYRAALLALDAEP
jgi:transposase